MYTFGRKDGDPTWRELQHGTGGHVQRDWWLLYVQSLRRLLVPTPVNIEATKRPTLEEEEQSPEEHHF